MSNTNETKWKISITLIEAKTWDFTGDVANNFQIDGKTLTFDAQTPFSKIGISKDSFTNELISTSLNEIHNLQSSNQKQELKENLLNNSNKLIESSFDIEKITPSEDKTNLKNDSALTTASLNISIKANTENGFEFIDNNSENNITKEVDYSYLNLYNTNLVDKLANSLTDLIWTNDKIIKNSESKQISVGNHKIDISYSTLNATKEKTFIGKSNGMGTFVYNLSVNFNDLNIADKSFTTQLQTKINWKS